MDKPKERPRTKGKPKLPKWQVWQDEGTFEDKLNTVRGMSAHGCNLQMKADYCGVSYRTFQSYISAKSPLYCKELADACKNGNKDLYFSSINRLVEGLDNENLSEEFRVNLAARIERMYRHRYLTDEDKANVSSSEESTSFILTRDTESRYERDIGIPKTLKKDE